MTEQTTTDISKELVPIKAQVTKAIEAASVLVIKTADDLTAATTLLGKIKQVGKLITSKKNSITKPLNEALRNARAFFSPVETQYSEAEAIVKNKMIAYQDAQTALAEKEAGKIEKKVEAGKMSFEQAAEKLDQVTPQKNVTTEAGAAQFRKIKEAVIRDEMKLPREYLVPDMVKIRKVALAGVAIPGVEVIEKSVVAGIVK